MIGMTKTISLAIILCLCIIPLDIQPAPAPMPMGKVSIDVPFGVKTNLMLSCTLQENTESRPWPDFVWVDLYTAAVIVVCAILVIYVAYWTRKNTVDPVDMHYLLNALFLVLQ